MAASGILKVKVAEVHFNNLGDSKCFIPALSRKKFAV